MFDKITTEDSVELSKLIAYCELKCTWDFSDMHKETDIHCRLPYYIKARIIGGQFWKGNKFNNLYILADSISVEYPRDLTYFGILMNKYIKDYFTKEELLSIFPVQNNFRKSEKTLIENVMLRFVINQDTIGISGMFDKLRYNNSAYINALANYIAFTFSQKSPNLLLETELIYLKGQHSISESEKQKIYKLLESMQSKHKKSNFTMLLPI